MHDTVQGRTWQVSANALRTGAIALALAAAFVAACEVAARTRIAADVLPAPSYGTRIRFFDLQMARLAAQARSPGGVDCLIFGSSAALQGLDPNVFSGKHLYCFNFGLPGASLWDVRSLAKVLVREYRPRLLVYGITPRDVGTGALGLQLHETPWIKREKEAFNLDGDLTGVSAAFRYFLAWRRWLDPSRPEPFDSLPTRADGFFPSSATLKTDALLTGWELKVVRQVGVYDPRTFSSFLDLTHDGTDVVIAEMPRAPALARRLAGTLVSHDSEEYRRFAAQLSQKAERAGATFVTAPGSDVVPADGWADFVHLNERGAAAFTTWLAERIPTGHTARDATSAPAARPGA